MKGAAALVGTALRAVRKRTETTRTNGRLGATSLPQWLHFSCSRIYWKPRRTMFTAIAASSRETIFEMARIPVDPMSAPIFPL